MKITVRGHRVLSATYGGTFPRGDSCTYLPEHPGGENLGWELTQEPWGCTAQRPSSGISRMGRDLSGVRQVTSLSQPCHAQPSTS